MYRKRVEEIKAKAEVYKSEKVVELEKVRTNLAQTEINFNELTSLLSKEKGKQVECESEVGAAKYAVEEYSPSSGMISRYLNKSLETLQKELDAANIKFQNQNKTVAEV